jgi:hypothetical protein
VGAGGGTEGFGGGIVAGRIEAKLRQDRLAVEGCASTGPAWRGALAGGSGCMLRA